MQWHGQLSVPQDQRTLQISFANSIGDLLHYQFTILVMIYKVLLGMGPGYLRNRPSQSYLPILSGLAEKSFFESYLHRSSIWWHLGGESFLPGYPQFPPHPRDYTGLNLVQFLHTKLWHQSMEVWGLQEDSIVCELMFFHVVF